MVGEFRASAESVGSDVEQNLLGRLASELDLFDVDPQHIDSYLREPSLGGNGSGTHFIIKPASPLLTDDIDGDVTASKAAALKKATPLKKALLGFSNTMASGSKTLIHTSFRDHKTDELVDDLIDADEFFTPDELQNADHRIRGSFDEFGQFRGEISIYGDAIADHVIPWSGGRGARTLCGPFSIDFAAFEAKADIRRSRTRNMRDWQTRPNSWEDCTFTATGFECYPMATPTTIGWISNSGERKAPTIIISLIEDLFRGGRYRCRQESKSVGKDGARRIPREQGLSTIPVYSSEFFSSDGCRLLPLRRYTC